MYLIYFAATYVGLNETYGKRDIIDERKDEVI